MLFNGLYNRGEPGGRGEVKKRVSNLVVLKKGQTWSKSLVSGIMLKCMLSFLVSVNYPSEHQKDVLSIVKNSIRPREGHKYWNTTPKCVLGFLFGRLESMRLHVGEMPLEASIIK